jgi:hypothetical protein
MGGHHCHDGKDAGLNRKEMNMDLIDRYAVEVGKNLPRKSRADIETEIRSTLQDMLEDRARKAGRPADDAMIRDLLTEYGAPKKVAASYLPERYLIGPRLYPFFEMVLKIVFSVLAVLALASIGIRIGQTDMTFASSLSAAGNMALGFLGGALQAFANIVIVFAILQRTLPASEFEDKAADWTPDELTREPDPDEVGLWSPIFEIVFTVAAILIFNFYPQILGIGFSSNGKWTFIPFLSETFYHFLPWINGIWVLDIIKDLLLLRQGRWQPTTRWYALAVKALGIVLAGALLAAPSLVGIRPEALTRIGSLPRESADLLVTMLNFAVRLALVIAIVAGSVELVRSAHRLIFRKERSVLPVG